MVCHAERSKTNQGMMRRRSYDQETVAFGHGIAFSLFRECLQREHRGRRARRERPTIEESRISSIFDQMLIAFILKAGRTLKCRKMRRIG